MDMVEIMVVRSCAVVVVKRDLLDAVVAVGSVAHSAEAEWIFRMSHDRNVEDGSGCPLV